MVLGYTRVAALDPVLAERTLAEAEASEPLGHFVIADNAELHRPEFLRVVELVRQGDGPAALRELESLGIRNKAAHPALL